MHEDTLVSALEKHTIQWGNIDKQEKLLMKCIEHVGRKPQPFFEGQNGLLRGCDCHLTEGQLVRKSLYFPLLVFLWQEPVTDLTKSSGPRKEEEHQQNLPQRETNYYVDDTYLLDQATKFILL